MRTDVEGEWAVGKIKRTAAGGAASLTVWQEFQFQLCTSFFFSPSALCSAFLCLHLHESFSIKQFSFFFFLSQFCAFLSPSLFFMLPLCLLPKPQHTHKVGLQSVSEGQSWCDSKWEAGGWEKKGNCLSWPWSTRTPQHNVTMKERGRERGEMRLYYQDVNMNTSPTDVVTWHRGKWSLFPFLNQPL